MSADKDLSADGMELRQWGDGVKADRNPAEELPLSQAAAGDEAAFAVVMQRMMPLMQSLIRQYSCPGVAERDDLAQESLMGLLAAIRTWRPESATRFTTYAYACIRNRLISLHRRCGGQFLREQPLEDDSEVPDAAQPDPAHLVQERESVEQLWRTLRERLTPLEQRVLLCRLGGCTYAQTAQQLGIDAKAVDNAVQRLRRKLPVPR